MRYEKVAANTFKQMSKKALRWKNSPWAERIPYLTSTLKGWFSEKWIAHTMLAMPTCEVVNKLNTLSDGVFDPAVTVNDKFL